jgi:transketolase
MRTAFVKALCELAAADERIWLLCGDLGYSVLEPFIERFPKRFVNVGIAEQNMIGVAAGLAMTNRCIFTYSIVNFATFRCLEQIRTDVCYHNLPVKIVSVGGGFSYSSQGYTHHGLEDIGAMRALPNITIMAPCDPWEARNATLQLAASPGPSYLRLARTNEPVLSAPGTAWRDGEPFTLRDGGEVLVISYGPCLSEILQAVDMSPELPVEVWSMPRLKPVPVHQLQDAAKRFPVIVKVEEGQIDGGLGSIVAEVIAELGIGTRLIRRGVDGTILEHALSQASARKRYGIDSASLRVLFESLCVR